MLTAVGASGRCSNTEPRISCQRPDAARTPGRAMTLGARLVMVAHLRCAGGEGSAPHRPGASTKGRSTVPNTASNSAAQTRSMSVALKLVDVTENVRELDV
jgi:hypothetical protein